MMQVSILEDHSIFWKNTWSVKEQTRACGRAEEATAMLKPKDTEVLEEKRWEQQIFDWTLNIYFYDTAYQR